MQGTTLERLALWGREHPARKWICVGLAVLIGVFVLVGIFGQSAQASTGCREVHNKKTFESSEPFYTDLAWGKLKVSWCWHKGKVTSFDVKRDADTTAAGSASQWFVEDKQAGAWYQGWGGEPHGQLIAYGKFRFKQEIFPYSNSGTKSIGIWVRGNGASSRDGGGPSGGGGGGSWRR